MRNAMRAWAVVGLMAGAALAGAGQQSAAPQAHMWALVLHGGAGVIERATMDPKMEAAYRASIRQAVDAAAKVLDGGGSSVDAVETAIQIL
jgi:beta-aspartyl-peptidase (threonine type)